MNKTTLAADIKNVLAVLKISEVREIKGEALLYFSSSVQRLFEFIKDAEKEKVDNAD